MERELLEYIIKNQVKKQIIISENMIIEKIHSLELEILTEIISVLKDSTLTDFEIVEKIVCIMEKYDIDCGTCHDFG